MWTKEQRRAYNKAYAAKRADYFKAYAESHRTERNAHLRERRAADPAFRAAEREASKRHRDKRKGTQWEITLKNGMKQYMFGYSENDAITRWCQYVNEKRSMIASIREYGFNNTGE